MDSQTLSQRVAAALSIAALALFSVGFTWAAVDDFTARDVMPEGASIESVGIGGMTRAQAARAVADRVEAPLMQPLTVTFMGTAIEIDPARFVTVEIEDALDAAASARTASILPARIWQRVTAQPVGRHVSDVARVDETALRQWVVERKRELTVPAVNATVRLKGSEIDFRPSRDGSTIDETATLDLVSKALVQGSRHVELPATRIAPRVTEETIGKTILVSRSGRSLTLYDGFDKEKAYRCAVGTPQFPTPLGTWKIVQKRYLPTWRNPGSDWAKDMPAYIGPGPGNPLGTRALNLNAPGIRIHGTTNDGSIGTAASHGCMRMHMWDIEDLYPRVPVGTKVFIVP